jgi:hypothetical protein
MEAWTTVIDFLPVADADASWQRWLSSHHGSLLRPEDILIDTGRGNTGDIRRYRIKESVMARIDAAEQGRNAAGR